MRVPQVLGLELLDHAARIHHQHAVAEGRDELEIVRDEDQAHAALGDELVENAQHLHRDRHVERRGRLVGDEQVGIGHQHHGDHGALAHAARHLVRIEREDALRIAHLHGLQHGERLVAGLAAAGLGMGLIGLDDLLADGHDRVQRIFRVLHHHADAPAAQGAQRALRGGEQVDPVEGEALGRHLAGGRGEAENGAARLRLAGARLAHDAEPLAAELEGHAAHRFHDAGAQVEADAQVFDVEKRLRHLAAFGSRTSRRPSPSRLKPRLTTKMARPGMAATHHWSMR